MFADEISKYVVFFCGHTYHGRCVSTKNEVRIVGFKYNYLDDRI